MRRGGRVGAGARWAAAALVLLVCATSCRKAETTVEVREDLTAKVSFLVVPGQRNLDELGGSKQFERLIRQVDNPGIGVRAKKVAAPGGMGMQVTVEARSLAALSAPVPRPVAASTAGRSAAAVQLV